MKNWTRVMEQETTCGKNSSSELSQTGETSVQNQGPNSNK